MWRRTSSCRCRNHIIDWLVIVLLSSSHRLIQPSLGGFVVINEVSDKGSEEGNCMEEDWIEVAHIPNEESSSSIDLSGMILHDDKGALDNDRFVFPNGTTLDPGQFLVLCRNDATLPTTVETNLRFEFGIGGDDTITLVNGTNGDIVSNVTLQDRGAFNVSFSRLDNGTYAYTIIPTPGGDNRVVQLPPEETVEERKARLLARNALGEAFFDMDPRGEMVPHAMEPVLDLEITMLPEDYTYLMENPLYEVYRPFQSARVVSPNGTEVWSSSPSLLPNARLRPRGQATLIIPTCMGIDTIPWLIDLGFNDDDTNNDTDIQRQTLFGVSRFYLRNHQSDASYLREWAQHRMLARFGLPYLRVRTVRFTLNGNVLGLYQLMEATDQEYVFARNFPNYDPHHFAIYKVKTNSIGCGHPMDPSVQQYVDNQIQTEMDTETSSSTPLYEFDRGEHRSFPPFPQNPEECFNFFFTVLMNQRGDALVSYTRHGKDCGEALVEEGLVDRDLGDPSFDPIMKQFLNEHYTFGNFCLQPNCTDSDLPSEVDVPQFLKNFAFYTATLGLDSPLGNGNNFFLAYGGEDGDNNGWKIIPWDLDIAGAALPMGVLCHDSCAEQMIHWSIVRPTCRRVEDNPWVGPILSKEPFLLQYLDYVQEFATTILFNDTFFDQVINHGRAIQEYVQVDVYNTINRDFWGHDYNLELERNAEKWNSPLNPFVPLLMARGQDIQQQLTALKEGTYPRERAHAMEDWETCVDWRLSSAPEPKCYQNCVYEGCKGICDESSGAPLCVEAEPDLKCDPNKIVNGEQYDNMEPGTFCWDNYKVNICPDPPSKEGEDNDNEFGCYQNCNYEGCNLGFCDTTTGAGCVLSEDDDKCETIANMEQYESMEENTFCWGGLYKVSYCPDPPTMDAGSATTMINGQDDDVEDDSTSTTDSTNVTTIPPSDSASAAVAVFSVGEIVFLVTTSFAWLLFGRVIN